MIGAKGTEMASKNAIPRAPILLKYFVLGEKIFHFDHERIFHTRLRGPWAISRRPMTSPASARRHFF